MLDETDAMDNLTGKMSRIKLFVTTSIIIVPEDTRDEVSWARVQADNGNKSKQFKVRTGCLSGRHYDIMMST